MGTENVMKMQQELAGGEDKAHYIPVETRFPFFCHYAYLDTEEYLADGLFVQARVRVHFGKEFVHPDSEYHLIFCKVRRKDNETFLAALQKLPAKMQLFGHKDYGKACRALQRMLNSSEKRDLNDENDAA